MDVPEKRAVEGHHDEADADQFLDSPEDEQRWIESVKKRLSSESVDSLEIVRASLELSNGSWSDFTSERKGDTLILRPTKCPMGDEAVAVGLSRDAICGGHQAVWYYLAQAIDPRIAYRVTKTLEEGDGYCEWVFTRL